MSYLLKRTWAEINLDHINANYKAIRSYIKEGCKIMSVVKADAYGHGVQVVARELEAAGSDYFGVSNIEEAKQLRNCGIKKPILILGFTPTELAADLISNHITQTVLNEEYANELSAQALAVGGQVTIHIKIDTGMGRIGFLYNQEGHNSESIRQILQVSKLKGLQIEGIFTHFAVSDEPEKDFTGKQFELFTKCIRCLHESGVDFKLRHCCNSAGILNFPQMQLDMVRPGIILYGLLPIAGTKPPIELKPVMELKTVVSYVKELEKDFPISYGMIYTTTQKTTIATLQVGYADGFVRSLSNSEDVLIRGSRARIIGRVCMDQCMADVTNIKDVKQGDIVTLIGRDNSEVVTMDEFAEKIGTINYEVACLISKRVPRVFFKDGHQTGLINYTLPEN
jgi:alanine racemase